jgi:hypothetical protein
MGSAAHGFVRPPPRLAASEMRTMAASGGGPAGPLSWLVSGVRQQARAATRDDNNNDDRVGTEE